MEPIFISYSGKNRPFVTQLANDLLDNGLNVFFDQLVDPGDSWAEALKKGIEQARYIVCVMTSDYFKSQWTMHELNIGLLQESKGQARVVPVLLEDCTIPLSLSSKMYLDFREQYDQPLSKLVSALRKEFQPVDTKNLYENDRLLKAKRMTETLDVFLQKTSSEKTFSEKGGRKCFIVMPFSEHDLNEVYEAIVKPTIVDCGLICERGDDSTGSREIIDDIMKSITQSDLIVADLTRKNANVFYEIGIAHALNKEVLLLSQTLDDVPFDLRHRRVLLYQNTAKGGVELRALLKKHLDSMPINHSKKINSVKAGG
jgi:hypothetical protein